VKKSIWLLMWIVFFAANFAEAASSCRSLFREEPQGYFVQVDEGQLHFINTKNADKLNGKRGRIDYSFNSETKTLLIEWVHVDPVLRELGVSHHLMTELSERYPEATQVIGYLTDKNLQIYEEALKSLKSPDLALKATPYFRSLNSLGFSEIIANDYFDGKVAVALKKPSYLP